MNSLFSASPLNYTGTSVVGIQGLKQSMSRMTDHAQNMQTTHVDTHNRITHQDKVNLNQTVPFDQDTKQYSSEEQLIYTSISGLEAKANAKVIQTSLDTMGTILDLKA
ncbi:hypothetical protein [Marinicellulosiphila megalodicopiae]|uniref:hypothetical protein n=1 Tax=Marinicellulosiphila megalodicopiae TaxID=2724896 RepID=UPI003BB0BDA1